MEAHLVRAFAGIQALPATAFDSPLAFAVSLYWGQLSGVPREFLDKTFEVGVGKFPDYLPLYRIRANHLMPRWFGEPGEMEAFVAGRAETIGGEAGDIFYARVVWSQIGDYSDIFKETKFSYDRFKRGMEALAKAQPASTAVPNALVRAAMIGTDTATAKAFFAAPRGHLIDKTWWSADQQLHLPAWRMDNLAK